MSAIALSPAGWATRRFTLDELEAVFSTGSPRLIEITKDFLREGISLKAVAAALARVREASGAEVAFAGTTDFMTCAGLPWDRYRQYLGVQIAQAKFLGCSLFRLFVGARSSDVTVPELIRRFRAACADMSPLIACVEIHGGMESDPGVLLELLHDASAMVLVDIEQARSTPLGGGELLSLVPLHRVAYFHQRNLPGVWTEHASSLDDERQWHRLAPDGVFLWEPKTIDDPARIQELFREYRRSH